MVYFNLESGNCTTVAAHDGEFASLSAVGDGVLTLGLSDGRAKYWRFRDPTPLHVYSAPASAVSMAVLDEDRKQSMLIFQDGTAEVHDIQGDAFVRQLTLPGRDYRVAIGPPPEVLFQLRDSRNRAAAARLLEEAELAQYHRHRAHLSSVCGQLIDRGFDRAAYSLEARYAMAEEDPIAELSARRQLHACPGVDNETVPSLVRYGELLAEWWQLGAALNVLGRCRELSEHSVAAGRIDRLRGVADALDRPDRCVITDKPLRTVARAASVLGSPFQGLWSLRRLPALQLPGVAMGEEELCEMLEGPLAIVWKNSERPNARTLLAVADDGVRRVSTITMPIANVFAFKVFYGIQWFPCEHGAAVEPFVGFDAGCASNESECHNEHASVALQHCGDDPSIKLRARATHESVVSTLRRLVTKSAARGYGGSP